jgi:C-terminal processing protease CtpA/Prc
LAAVHGLVIDLRGSDGASSEAGLALLSLLSAEPATLPPTYTRADDGIAQAQWGPAAPLRWRRLERKPDIRHRDPVFQGPVAVLIDERTYSTAEEVATLFKRMKRGIVVGTASGGSAGRALTADLPGGGHVRICVERVGEADGSSFVGHGVQPDIEAKPSLAALRGGEDPAMKSALEALAKRAAI